MMGRRCITVNDASSGRTRLCTAHSTFEREIGMLTNQEHEWLERRKNICERCSNRKWCRVGKRHGYNTTSCRFHKQNFKEDYYGAAKFADRVALWLLSHDFEDVPCANGMTIFCPHPPFAGDDCGKWCLLRMARLAVEEELEVRTRGR